MAWSGIDANALFGIDFSNGASVQFGTLPFRNTDLAGKSLATSPFFEYVRAFNQGLDSIQIAIDPGRFPFVVGQTAKAYVVAKKTAAQWDADHALVDLTANGPDVIALGGGIDPERHVHADAALGGGGPSIGAGYDVVLDLDQDGFLGPGDV